MNKFWMVWCPNDKSLSIQYYSETSAQSEARRLAALRPYSDFYVIEAKSLSKANIGVLDVIFDAEETK